jgi:hypothetical protein
MSRRSEIAFWLALIVLCLVGPYLHEAFHI